MYWRYRGAERVQSFTLTVSTLYKNTVNTVKLSDFYWAYRPETVYWPVLVLKYLSTMTQLHNTRNRKLNVFCLRD